MVGGRRPPISWLSPLSRGDRPSSARAMRGFLSSPRMDLTTPLSYQPPPGWQRVTVVDSHTGGEPFRVVISGVPQPEGRTVLERRRFAEAHLDHLRRILMWEPRGHADMSGGLIGPPTTEGSDLSVLFMHNEGFSQHVRPRDHRHDQGGAGNRTHSHGGPETTIRIDSPAGPDHRPCPVSGGVVKASTSTTCHPLSLGSGRNRGGAWDSDGYVRPCLRRRLLRVRERASVRGRALRPTLSAG